MFNLLLYKPYIEILMHSRIKLSAELAAIKKPSIQCQYGINPKGSVLN